MKNHVYILEHLGDYWTSVTDVQCPVCRMGTVRWTEDGHVPGHRTCDQCGVQFIAQGSGLYPTLVEID